MIVLEAAGSASPTGTAFTSPHFSITLPTGWRVVFSRPEPIQQIESGMGGAIAMEARAADGGFLRLWFGCPATEVSGDEMWDLEPDESGRAVKAITRDSSGCDLESKKACIESAGDDEEALAECHYCGAGDGLFEAWARFNGKAPFDSVNVCVHFGNISREDVDLATYQRMLSTLRVEGPTGAPEPKLPGWDERRPVPHGDFSAFPAALQAASKTFPMAVWRTEEVQAGDFTYDGKPDMALLGFEASAVHVVVIEGPVTERSRVLAARLSSGRKSRDSLCGHSDRTHLVTENPAGGCAAERSRPECSEVVRRLPAASARKGAMGLRLASRNCHTFHVFFDGKGLTWWRREQPEKPAVSPGQGPPK